MSFYDGIRDLMGITVRAIGMVLLLFGLWLALEVLNEAWQLYHDPGRIERFAEAIEQGSNIDRSIAPLQIENPAGADAEQAEDLQAGELNAYGRRSETAQSADTTVKVDPRYRLRLSYYIAWVITLLLLLLLARISLAAVRTGGELVLYETQMKRFARELIRESSQGSRDQR